MTSEHPLISLWTYVYHYEAHLIEMCNDPLETMREDEAKALDYAIKHGIEVSHSFERVSYHGKHHEARVLTAPSFVWDSILH